jgi:hypothetical protein
LERFAASSSGLAITHSGPKFGLSKEIPQVSIDSTKGFLVRLSLAQQAVKILQQKYILMPESLELFLS